MIAPSSPSVPAGRAFDSLAADYDSIFTFSRIGRSQRDVVRNQALATFASGSHILELNCGTGEDALFLAQHGMRVTACDASAAMIANARTKTSNTDLARHVNFYVLASEDLKMLPPQLHFDGVFSNFSGLNCVQDLRCVANELAKRLRSEARIMLCFSTRYCAWETGFYLLHGNRQKAFRRSRGSCNAKIGTTTIPVYYPSPEGIQQAFSPEFRLISVTGVGITVPPSYMEGWVLQHPRFLRAFEAIDSTIRSWPFFRTLGDHMLLLLERA